MYSLLYTRGKIKKRVYFPVNKSTMHLLGISREGLRYLNFLLINKMKFALRTSAQNYLAILIGYTREIINSISQQGELIKITGQLSQV